MSHGGSSTETEIKLRVRDATEGRRLLRSAGFHVVSRRVFESNVLYDTPSGTLRSQKTLLRIRKSGSHAILTYKSPPVGGKYKSREEIETKVNDPEALREILTRLGYQGLFRYEKYRTVYQGGDHSGVATLDETPVGAFLELEGEPAWIDATAECLGFSESDYIKRSYYFLYVEYCKLRGEAPSHMIFDSESAPWPR
ncbi:MAG: class IV adenylate cyclase [Bryobacteraceae bacterium]